MRDALAVSRRILRQFKHDPRTLFMMIGAPVLALFLLDVIFGSPDYRPLLLADGVPSAFLSALEGTNARVQQTPRAQAIARLRSGDADGFVTHDSGRYAVWVEGTDPAKTAAVLRAVGDAIQSVHRPRAQDLLSGAASGQLSDIRNLLAALNASSPATPTVTYVHGSKDMRAFDYYGPVFIGVFVFFFVFITSGISFVRERTGGTLERLMATPIHRWELVLGYVQGFGLFTLVQGAIVVAASIYWVGFPNRGNFWLVLAVALSMALVSLTLGILVSEFANTELQVMQLLQIVVVPQILLSGMFDLSQTPRWMQVLSRLFPVTYGADAMRAVMLRGAGLADVRGDLLVLWGFVAAFFAADVLALKKYRRI